MGKCKMLRSGLGRKPADNILDSLDVCLTGGIQHPSQPPILLPAGNRVELSILLEWLDGSMGHNGTMVVL